MWINKHKLNNSLAVFIHGLGGKRYGTWEGLPERLQEECADDPRIRSYDLYLFGYETSLRRQPGLDPWVVAGLDRFLGSEESQEKYKTVVLIGHSQGGILAKLYIIDKLRKGSGEKLTVDLVITVFTPHRGISPLNLNPLLWLQRVFGDRIPLRQFNELASLSQTIRTLKENWDSPYISRDPCPPTAQRRYIRSLAVAGARDFWVGKNSAMGFPSVDYGDYSIDRHTGLGKSPEFCGLIIEKLQAHEYPKSVVRSIKEIRASSTETAKYVQQNCGAVEIEVRLSQPGWGSGIVKGKTDSILVDFLYDFEQRPLRCLTLEESLRVYAERQMKSGG